MTKAKVLENVKIASVKTQPACSLKAVSTDARARVDYLFAVSGSGKILKLRVINQSMETITPKDGSEVKIYHKFHTEPAEQPANEKERVSYFPFEFVTLNADLTSFKPVFVTESAAIKFAASKLRQKREKLENELKRLTADIIKMEGENAL